MKIYKLYFLILIIFYSVFFITQKTFAMPVGTLLYRTSAGGQMYGYNTNELLEFEGIKAKINCGHVGIYAGQDENGQDMVLEAVNNGVQLTPAKYFINKGNGEKLVGAKIPKKLTSDDSKFLKQITGFLGSQNLAYDFEFKYQKGPDSGQWICVGLTEKIYESLGFDKKFDLSNLEYNPQNYYIDITSDRYDKNSLYNFEKSDCFSTVSEYSKIGKRLVLGEAIGYDLGKVENGYRYFFLPYTQFLQQGLVDVEVDILLEANFKDEEIRGKMPKGKMLAKMFVNNTKSSAVMTMDGTRSLALKIKNIFSKQADSATLLAQNKPEAGFVMPANENGIGNAKKIELENLVLPTEKNYLKEIKTIINKKEPILKKPVLAVKTTENKEAASIKKEIKQEADKLKIDYVIDGDTFILSTGERVRYIGIDTPELGEDGSVDDECLAWAARLRNMELLAKGELRLVKDKNADKDKYGRLLRYVYIGDIFVNRQLAQEGLARTFFCESNWENCPETKNEEEKQIILNASKYAEDNSLGIFSNVCEKEKVELEKETVLATTTEEIVKEEIKKEIVIEETKQQFPLFHTGGEAFDKEDAATEEIVLEVATTTEEIVVSTTEIFKILISEFSARGASGEADDEFVELYNPATDDVNLMNWRLQYKSATGDSWKNKTGPDGLPEIIILAKKYLLLAGDGYFESVTPDYQHDATWGLADGGGQIRVIDNLGNEIDKIGYGNAIDPELEAIEIDFSKYRSLERKAVATSTEFSMIIGGEHWTFGNGYDSDNNKDDFVVRLESDPQNSASEEEPRLAPLIKPERIDELVLADGSITTSSVELAWDTPGFANLGDGSFYDLRYVEKEDVCEIDSDWDVATSVSADLLPIPATTTEKIENFKIDNLSSNTDYCLAIKTYNSQQWSEISNIVEIKTLEVVEVEETGKIEVGEYNQHYGTFISALAWKHEIKEESNLLIVVVFMNSRLDYVKKIIFSDQEMKLLSKSVKRPNVNYEIFYLDNPPLGEFVIYLEADRENSLTGFSVDFSNVDIDNFPVSVSSNFTGEKIISTIVNNEYENSLGLEVLMVNNWVDIPTPGSDQNVLIRRRTNYDYFGFNSFSVLSVKNLAIGDNELAWVRELNQIASQDVIVLKPK